MYLDGDTIKMLRIVLRAAGPQGVTVEEVAEQLQGRMMIGIAREIDELVSKKKADIVIGRDAYGKIVGPSRFVLRDVPENEEAI